MKSHNLRGCHSRVAVCVISDNALIHQVLKRNLKRSAKFLFVEHHKLLNGEHSPSGVAIVDINSVDRNPGRVPLLGFARSILLGDPLVEDDIFHFLSFGINGFVRYCEVERKLRQAVEVVASGRLYVSRAILEHFVAYARSSRTAKTAGPLTPRQEQILHLLQEHYSNKQISSQLEISENTVKFHLAKIYNKLGVSDRHTAVNQLRLLPRTTNAAETANAVLHVPEPGRARNLPLRPDALECIDIHSGSSDWNAEEPLPRRAAR